MKHFLNPVWDESFSIDRKGNLTKFTNKSARKMIISIKPAKGKRKVVDFMLVPPDSWVIDEHGIDLSQIYIGFVD